MLERERVQKRLEELRLILKTAGVIDKKGNILVREKKSSKAKK